MNGKLFVQAISKYLLGVAAVGLMIFWPAGTTDFFGGWLLMGILFVPMFFAGVFMMFKSPELLKKRLNMKERQQAQGLVIKLSGLMFLAGFLLAGFGVRFGWYQLPKGVQIGAAAVFVIAYLLYAEVLRENAYLSRTVEVQEGQKVVDTGLYAIVRHPMYCVTVLLFLSMPLILGSLYGFLVFLVYPGILVLRIRDEEALLERELEGYREYKQKVKYRLLPFIW